MREMNSLQRKGLINGGIAAVITFVIGTAVVAATDGGSVLEPVTASPSSAPSPVPACEPSWEVVPSANVAETPVTLQGVVALTAGEAWAVGSAGDPEQPSDVVVQSWNGVEWSNVEAPSPGSFINELAAVDASGPNDVWAVGRTSSGFGESPLVLHYDGTSWAEVQVPDEIDGHLNDVAAVSPADVWAVGSVGDPAASLERALVLHWNGATWENVDVHRAIGGGKALLRDIHAVSPTDLWVVGYHHNDQPLILRFDGQAWSDSETEIPGELNAIEGFTTGEAWAVGTPIQRFNGTAWTESDTIRGDTVLADVTAVSALDVWTVGWRPAGAEGAVRVAVARWDGQRWKFVDGPPVGGSDALTAVDALPDGTVLAVGTKDVDTGRRTLAVRGATCVEPG
jgi:hypothetical protein